MPKLIVQAYFSEVILKALRKHNSSIFCLWIKGDKMKSHVCRKNKKVLHVINFSIIDILFP